MLADIARSAPRGMPNVFLIGITEAQKEPVREMLRLQPGVEGTPEIVPNVSVRLVSVNGTPVEYLRFQGWGRRFLQTRPASFSAAIPEHTEILQGTWCITGSRACLSVAEEAAKILGVQPGSRLQFSAFGRTMDVQVASIHRTEAIRVGANNEFIFDPATLAGLPAIFYGGVRVKPSDVSALQRVAYQKFPTVSVINAADVLQIVQDVVDQIALVIRFISLFTILAGVIILASSVAGTRFRRIREVVINLHHLGALIEQHVGDGARFGLAVRYSREPVILLSHQPLGFAEPKQALPPEQAEVMRVIDDAAKEKARFARREATEKRRDADRAARRVDRRG